MANKNFLYITGRLVRDSELKEWGENKFLTKFTIAVNHVFRKKNEEKKDGDTSFFDVTLWSKKYLRQGSAVDIIGKIKQETWTDKNSGDKRSKVGIVADKIIVEDVQEEQEQPPKEVDPITTIPENTKTLLRNCGYNTVAKVRKYCEKFNWDIQKIEHDLLNDDIPF